MKRTRKNKIYCRIEGPTGRYREYFYSKSKDKKSWEEVGCRRKTEQEIKEFAYKSNNEEIIWVEK